MVKKEKDDFLAAQGFAAANCLIRDAIKVKEGNNMPRTSRMIISDEKAVYHVMSRTALDGFPLMDVEKDFMLDLIKKFSSLYFAEILGFCLMGNHFTCWLKCFLKTAFRMKIFKSALRRFTETAGHLRKTRFPFYGQNYQAFLNLSVK